MELRNSVEVEVISAEWSVAERACVYATLNQPPPTAALLCTTTKRPDLDCVPVMRTCKLGTPHCPRVSCRDKTLLLTSPIQPHSTTCRRDQGRPLSSTGRVPRLHLPTPPHACKMSIIDMDEMEEQIESFNARPLEEIRPLVPPLPASYDSSHELTLYTPKTLPPTMFEACFSLLEATQKHMYERSRGWSPSSKRKEMNHPAMRYLILTSTSGEFEGFLSCMITIEDIELAVYCYELHLVETARGKGLGEVLMGAMEGFGRKAGMRKGMLTVFMENEGARRFYERIGYFRDVNTPEPRVLRGGKVKECGYEIRSKEL